MEQGRKWLHQTFPFLENTINTLWQLDPFGNSATTPLIFSGDYKYAVLNRVGDNIKDQLKKSSQMDFLWTNPLNKDSGLLTHVLNIHYQTEQKEWLEHLLEIDKKQNQGQIKNHGKRLKKIRDWIIGPNL